MKSIFGLFSCFFLFVFCVSPAGAEEYGKPKLYRLDCGSIEVLNLNVFSDTDQYVGQTKTLVSSCYLINAGTNWLLWDTGLPSEIAKEEDGQKNESFHLKVTKTIVEQLDSIGLVPEDITHVAISHGHFDHTGNIEAFPNATIIMQQAEYDLFTKYTDIAKANHFNDKTIEFFSKKENQAKVKPITKDYDFFGNGRVKAISLPGHTPGHMALKIDLVNSGTVILSGDQWHFIENRVSNGVPSLNSDRVQTLASSDRLNKLVQNTGAKLIIQHEPTHVELLPAFPEFLD
ncbi:MAG: N-acyl homoserine lactonase family protein [Alphaproteobacteria bacterium]|nr:N-acyl homoserine lactonase family protein [Alphaproteobacteria bacterium]